MPAITPYLWFDTQALEAAEFYVSVFKDSRIGTVSRYGKDMPMPEGTVLTAQFWIAGQEFTALNAGPNMAFTPAVSFAVHCDTQEDIDAYWEKLTADGGSEWQCGWLKDKYGLSWQIVPSMMSELLAEGDGNREKFDRMMQAMLPMKKLDIATLQRAYDGK